jgi:tryptophan-rich sensory protein
MPTNAERTQDFFESLVKPSWIPPDWAFPVAWFTLWTLQAVALARIASANSAHRTLALGALVAQFVLSIAWQWGVFGPGRLRLAAWWLTGVLVLDALTVLFAWRADRWGAALIAPTVVWMSVATALGWSLLRLNPGA